MDKTDAQIKGEQCEKLVKNMLMNRCHVVIPLKKGADFLCVGRNGKISFHEAKCNKSNLTPFEKRFRKLVEKIRLEYNIERCACPLRKT